MINDDQSPEAPRCGLRDKSQAESWKAPDSVYLGLGSNVGDREANLQEAIARIKRLGLEVTRASSIYETEPVGYADQSWFLNQVIEVRVDLQVTFDKADEWASAEEWAAISRVFAKERPYDYSQWWILGFFNELQAIELEMGRKRDIPNGPRVIDIDILLFEEMVGFYVQTWGERSAIAGGPPLLTIPHPRMHERRFVLEPLCEIAPDLLHPISKKTCRELLTTLDDASVVRRY